MLSYQAKQGLGLSYNQKLGYGAVGAVRVYLTSKHPSAKLTSKGLVSVLGAKQGGGSILHPSFSLVLGLVLRERIKSKK